MKGKNTFTAAEVSKLRDLLKLLREAPCAQKKSIRSKMRTIGFYMQDDWGITQCGVKDLDALIKDGRIKVIGSNVTHSCVPRPQIQEAKLTLLSQSTSVKTKMGFKTIKELQAAGFTGFVPVEDLWSDCSVIPKVKGVYLVARQTNEAPDFLAIGTGAHFKGKDPNVLIETLRMNWVEDTCVVYIGKAGGEKSSATLHSRLRQYLQFGQGKPIGHQGGCYIWQLKDAANLLFCWKQLPGDDPRSVEKDLIASFKSQYSEKRPFANRKD